MPKPHEKESKADFISRAIKVFMKEGLSHDKAVGRAFGFWATYHSSGSKKN